MSLIDHKVKRLRVWCAAAAAVGASLWAFKGLAVLITGVQPDHVFEVAPFFFGVSAITLVYSMLSELRRPAWLLASLGWLAVTAGATAVAAHAAQGDDEVGDPAYLVHFLSTLVLFFLIAGDIRRARLLARWPLAPLFLAWAMLAVIPLGAVLEVVNERLLEVPLVAVSVGWAMMAVAALSLPRPTKPNHTTRP